MAGRDWKHGTERLVAKPASGTDEASQAEDTNVAGTSPEFPVTVELGSTPQEIDRAISLCKRAGAMRRIVRARPMPMKRLRTVTLAPFEIDRTEVTNADFERFVQADRIPDDRRGARLQLGHHALPPLQLEDTETGPTGLGSSERSGRPRLVDRRPGLLRMGGFAAPDRGRMGIQRPRPRSADLSMGQRMGCRKIARHPCEGPRSRARRLPSKGATPEGIQDMAGSVWEWTSTPSGNKEKRIEKGGSWSEEIPSYFRSAAFTDDPPDYSGISTGFRCARDLES